EEGGSPPPVVI
uniref:Bradykinin-potentiating peptide 5 n=1 Tax=Bothrops neuwiedi TaxID=95648 RepID=BPP5_BOTNU|nr:RecName: Full=Bradykinin-potentiating peptide 5; Short=BPP-5; AltName: Full=BPP-V [Bothrops neuwiedi]